MGLILKIIIVLIILGIVIEAFEKVTGINITDGSGEEKPKEPEKVLSPLERELQEIKQDSYGHTKKIIGYIIELYDKPYVEMESAWSSVNIEKIVSKYIDNQLLFSEKYEGHVIDLSGTIETIGKEGKLVYVNIGDGSYYHRSGRSGDGVKQLVTCYLDENDMNNESYKNIVLNMRPGTIVTIVGVLYVGRFVGFELHGSTLIEVDGTVPENVMSIAVNAIYDKYDTGSEDTSC